MNYVHSMFLAMLCFLPGKCVGSEKWQVNSKCDCFWRISEESFVRIAVWREIGGESHQECQPHLWASGSTGENIHECSDLPQRYLSCITLCPSPPNGKVTKPSLSFHLELLICVPLLKSLADSEIKRWWYLTLLLLTHSFRLLCSHAGCDPLHSGMENKTVVFVQAKII